MGEENTNQQAGQGQAAENGKKESTIKLNNQLIALLLVLGGIVIILISVFLICMPAQTDIESLKMTLEQKEAEYQQTLAIAAKQAQYEQEIAVDEANIKNILAQYPSDVKYEDEIFYVKDILETNYATLDFSSLGFSPQLMVISSDQALAAQSGGAQAADTTSTDATATDANAAGGMSGYQLYSTPLSLAGTIGYDDFKSLIDYINHDTQKKNYDSINLSFDENSGNLSVSMNLNFLTIGGTDNVYTPSVIPDNTGIGKENIFGSIASGGTGTETVLDTEGANAETTDNAGATSDAGTANSTASTGSTGTTKKSGN